MIGLLLFAAAEHHRRQNDLYRIEVTPRRIELLAAAYRAEFGSPPSAETLKILVGHYVEEEALYREAVVRGLDRDDEIVRRRMVQKMQFLLQDLSVPPPPTETELRSYYQAHLQQYAEPTKITFSHVFFEDGAAGAKVARARAETALRRLSPDVQRAPQLGDNFVDRYDYVDMDAQQALRVFGRSELASRLFTSPSREWIGPLRSAYGWHLVYVQSVKRPSVSPFDELRERVRSDLTAERAAASNRRRLASLTSHFTIAFSAETKR